jgi:hypothetical protein
MIAHRVERETLCREEEAMLGEKVGDFQGKITGQRMLQSDGAVPKFETSAEVRGTILGIEATVMATYWAVLRPDGHLYGECPDQGMVITKDGDTAMYKASGLGKFTGQGTAVSFRGAAYFQTTSPKLARLNEVALVHEWDVDEQGNGHWQLWAWT